MLGRAAHSADYNWPVSKQDEIEAELGEGNVIDGGKKGRGGKGPKGPRKPAKEHLRAEIQGIPAWKKIALALAGVFMLAGGAMATLGGDESKTQTSSSPATGSPTSGSAGTGGAPATAARPNSFRGGDIDLGDILGGGSTPEPTPSAESESMWTPLMLKGGFSFFAAFCVGFAARAFFKVSAFALGGVFLLLFGLSYAGVVEVDWDLLGGWFDKAKGAVGDQLSSFRTFITGSLPSTASGTLGLVAGFKR